MSKCIKPGAQANRLKQIHPTCKLLPHTTFLLLLLLFTTFPHSSYKSFKKYLTGKQIQNKRNSNIFFTFLSNEILDIDSNQQNFLIYFKKSTYAKFSFTSYFFTLTLGRMTTWCHLTALAGTLAGWSSQKVTLTSQGLGD